MGKDMCYIRVTCITFAIEILLTELDAFCALRKQVQGIDQVAVELWVCILDQNLLSFGFCYLSDIQNIENF